MAEETTTPNPEETEFDAEETLENDEALAALRAQLDDAKSDALRARADYQNLKRRTEEERESLKQYLIEDLVTRLLPVVDNFERAINAAAQTNDYDKLIGGITATYKQFADILVAEGIQVIPAAPGQEFDPNYHNAVMTEPSDEQPDNTILAELQRGYLLGGRVLRPTLVKVAASG